MKMRRVPLKNSRSRTSALLQIFCSSSGFQNKSVRLAKPSGPRADVTPASESCARSRLLGSFRYAGIGRAEGRAESGAKRAHARKTMPKPMKTNVRHAVGLRSGEASGSAVFCRSSGSFLA